MSDEYRLTIRIPKNMKQQILEESNITGNSISSIIRIAVNSYFLKKEKSL